MSYRPASPAYCPPVISDVRTQMHPNEFASSVLTAIQEMVACAADDGVRERVQSILAAPGVEMLARRDEEYLFRCPMRMREDYPEYEFFVLGHLLEVRRIGHFSNQYSFVNFPAKLAEQRSVVESRFVEISLITEDGMGWFAPARWEDLNEEQQAICRPRFIEDNVTGLSM